MLDATRISVTEPFEFDELVICSGLDDNWSAWIGIRTYLAELARQELGWDAKAMTFYAQYKTHTGDPDFHCYAELTISGRPANFSRQIVAQDARGYCAAKRDFWRKHTRMLRYKFNDIYWHLDRYAISGEGFHCPHFVMTTKPEKFPRV